MLLLTSSFAFADVIQDNNIELIDVGNSRLLEDELSGPIIDSSEFHAQIKPATKLYDGDETIFQNDKFASYYFFSLKNNFGYNTHGSCGYVAVAMLLSYYDTYLDDRIIENDDDLFDVAGTLSTLDLSDINNVSPGIKRESNVLCLQDENNNGDDAQNQRTLDALNCEDYWSVIENNANEYFHLYLIKLAEEKFNMYHETYAILEECGIRVPTNSSTPCASMMLHQKSVVEAYLYEVKGYTEHEVSLEYTSVDVRNFAINKIKCGQPVILFLGSPTGFHLVTAYDLNDNGTEDNSDDEIYAHYGWSEYKTHINIDTDDYPWLISALAVNFSIDHSCAFNYTMGGETYCSCFLMCHPDHYYTYTSINTLYHKGECIHCMHETDNISHIWVDYSSTYYACRDCGLLKIRKGNEFNPIIKTEFPEEELKQNNKSINCQAKCNNY